MEDPLLHRRHELAVLVEDPVRPDQQVGVVERPGPVGLPFVHADPADDAVLAARLGQAIGERPGDVHRLLPQPLPQFIPAAERSGVLCPGVRRVERHEGLGERRHRDAVGCRLAEDADCLVDRSIRVEDHGRRLDRRDADGLKARHLPSIDPLAGPSRRRRGRHHLHAVTGGRDREAPPLPPQLP